MKIYYQWLVWSYSSGVAKIISEIYNNQAEIEWLFSFKDVFEKLSDSDLWVIPIENSYAWSIHENFYNLSNFDCVVVWEYYKTVNHCLLSKWDDISKIKYVYSHPQALMQCEWYLNRHWIKALSYSDTASAADYISKQDDISIAAISSSFCSEIYWLNILDKSIQDQWWNTTRFFIIKKSNSWITIPMNNHISESKKISLLFKAKHQPASLYKCLWCFATRNINLTKIESLSAQDNPFEYMFWIDIEKTTDKSNIDSSLQELSFFTEFTKILWEY